MNATARTRTPRRPQLLIGAAALTLTLGLTACDPGDDPTDEPTTEEPTTEEPTTEEPTQSQRDQDIDAGRQAYIDYVAATDSAAQDGWENEELYLEVIALVGAEMYPVIDEERATYQENNLRQEGEVEVVSVEATDYSSGGGGAAVTYDVCLDTSDVVTLMDGEPQEGAEPGGRNAIEVETQRQQQDGDWVVTRSEPTGGSC